MSPEESGPCEGVRVRHDPHSHPRLLSWGCPTPAAQLPSLRLQGRGGKGLLVPPRWAAPSAPTQCSLGMSYASLLAQVLHRSMEETPGKLQQHHLGSARHPSGDTPCCPGREGDL